MKQVKSVFVDPCDSRSIGMTTVSKLNLVEGEWNAQDIASKCIILPDDDKFPNPLPEEVRLLADSTRDMVAKRDSIFGKAGEQSWTVISLLLPNREYWKSWSENCFAFLVGYYSIILCGSNVILSLLSSLKYVFQVWDLSITFFLLIWDFCFSLWASPLFLLSFWTYCADCYFLRCSLFCYGNVEYKRIVYAFVFHKLLRWFWLPLCVYFMESFFFEMKQE